DGNKRELGRRPMIGAEERRRFRRAIARADLVELVDLVADGERANDPGLDIVDEVGDLGALREPEPRDADAILDPGAPGLDGAQDGADPLRDPVIVEDGGAGVEAREVDGAGRE